MGDNMHDNLTLEEIETLLNCNQILYSNLNTIKEQFIKYYGESLRNKIDTVFSNVMIVMYRTLYSNANLITVFQHLITKKIIGKYLSQDSLWNIDELVSEDFVNTSFSDKRIFNLRNFVEFYKARQEGQSPEQLEQLFKQAEPLLQKIDPDITCSNYSYYAANPKLQELERLAEEYPRMLYEYNMNLKPYSLEIENKKYYDNQDEKKKNISLGDKESLKTIGKIDEEAPIHRRIREEINKLDLLKKSDGFDSSLYGFDVIGNTIPNIKFINRIPIIYSLVYINATRYDESKYDHCLVHELNHLYESFLVNISNDSYDVLSGWELVNHKINDTDIEEAEDNSRNSDFRPYELFNEIINDMITQEIVEQMHKDGIYLFDKPNAQPFKSRYQFTRFLVEEFYKRYKDKIIESRRDGNIEIIWNEVGKENFDALNELFHEFRFENDLCSPVEAQKRKELSPRLTEILHNMEEYKKSHQTNSIESRTPKSK